MLICIFIMLNWILILAVSFGQLIKFPSLNSSGVTVLDLVILSLASFGILKFKQFKKPSTSILLAFTFTIVCFFSLIFTPLQLNLFQFLISLSYTIRLAVYFFVGYLIYCQIIKINTTKIIIYSSLILSILGLLQLIFLPDLKSLTILGWDPHYFRTVSTFLDPNFLGAFLSISVLLLLVKTNLSKKKGLVFIFLIIFFALTTTFSRSSYLMFIVSGLTLSFFKKSFRLSALVLTLSILFFLAFQIYNILVSKPRNIDRNYSANARLNTWQEGIAIFRQNPFLGTGFNTYRYALTQYNLADESFVNQRGATSNDSSLLHILATTGISGLITYLGFIYTLIKSGIKKEIIAASSIFGLLVHSIFNNSLFYPPILLWISLISTNLNLTKDNNI